MAMDLDLIYRDLGYTNTFKNLCKLKQDRFIQISGYQLDKFKRLLGRFNISYQVLDIGYGFKIELKEEL